MTTRKAKALEAVQWVAALGILTAAFVWVIQVSKAVDTILHTPMCTLPPAK